MSARPARALVAAVAVVAAGMLAAACGTATSSSTVPGGDPSTGQQLIAHYGCGACHVIGGIRGADGTVGPVLQNFGRIHRIAGVLPKTPANTVRWLLNPPRVKPSTDMPNLRIPRKDATDIVSYLYTQ